jgi:D-arginine dehydrogenase
VRIAVIGAGIAGASAAWELSADHEVTLIEQEPQPGLHATGRSAAVLSETSGLRPVCALARASRAFLEGPPSGFSDHPITGPRGLLWVGEADDVDVLDDLAAVAASGVAPTARRIDGAEARRLVSVLRENAVAGGGVYEPDARSIDVAALLQSYVSGARHRGATVLAGAPMTGATHIEPVADSGWRLTVDGTAELDVDVIVNAAGAWGDVVATMAGVTPVGLRPLRRTAFVTPVQADAAWPMVMDIANRYYFEPEQGGVLASAADETLSEPCDARAEEEDIARAMDALGEATTLGARSVRHHWAGLRTFAPDRVPVLGPDVEVPSFVWLVGQGGAGIKTAPAMAACVRSTIDGSPWPVALTALGVTADDLSPARLR